MNDLRSLAMNLLASNPAVANNPNAQSMIDVIRRGDAAQGEQIARNICATMGVTPEQAFAQARKMFRF